MSVEDVVVPVGPSDGDRAEPLAEAAAATADATGATIHVVHVHSPSEYAERTDSLNYERRSPPDASALARRSSTVRVVSEALDDRLSASDATVKIHGFVDEHVGTAIVEFAADVDADRLVVGGRRRSAVGKVVFGSTAQSLLLDAPCPVTFVREDLAESETGGEAASTPADPAPATR